MSVIRADAVGPSAGGTTRSLVRGTAAAWVNFNGTGTVAIRDSENVSSLTDNGTGDFNVNFTNNYAGADYVTDGQMAFTTNINTLVYSVQPRNASTLTTSYAGIYSVYGGPSGSGAADYPYNSFISHGDLA